MSRPIAATPKPIILVGAGQASPQEVTNALRFGERVVAADGGARVALEAGVMPHLVVGDLDSLDDADAKRITADRLVRIDNQDTTDFEKVLSVVDAPVILAVGFLGGRLDHQLAAFSAILKDPRPVVLLGGGEIAFLARGRVRLELGAGCPVALYPLVPVEAWSKGMVWDVDGQLAPGGLISTSNRMVKDVLDLDVKGDGLLVIVGEEALPRVLGALV